MNYNVSNWNSIIMVTMLICIIGGTQVPLAYTVVAYDNAEISLYSGQKDIPTSLVVSAL